MTETPGTERALAAARAVALANSVACEDAVVVAAGSNVLVHLKPAPVIARVMTGTAWLHENVERWLAREVAVGAFLGEQGLAVPPSDVLAPGPHQHEGLWMTFWAFVEHDASRPLPGAHELGGSLRELHAALADFPGELGQLSDVRDWLDRLLAELHPSPGLTPQDRDVLRSQLRELTSSVFESSLPAQAIHGDASISNLLGTENGLIWNDLEDTCVGPVHWDVAGLVTEARARGASEAFVADFLRAYGGPDLEELDPFIAAHLLYTTVWQAFDAQRRASRPAVTASRPATSATPARSCSDTPSTAPCVRWESTDVRARAESTDPSDPADPTEKADAKEPIEPIDSAEPTEPMERNEPLEHTDRKESSDRSDSVRTSSS